MDNRYLQIVRRIEELLKPKPVSDNLEQDLRQRIATVPWTVNFDQFADAFNSFYWKRNFWKAAYFFSYDYSLTAAALNRLTKLQSMDVTVIGSGAGSDVLAFMAWFNCQFPLTKLNLTLIDRSQKQLDTMALFIQHTAELMTDIDIAVRYLQMDSAQWQPTTDSADLILLSNFLVENQADAHVVLQKTRDAVRPGGDVVIMERPNQVVLDHAKQALADAGLTVYDTTINDQRMELIKQGLTDLGNTGLASRYLRATQPDTKRKAELIAGYFDAWRQQVFEPIYDSCDPNAQFDFRPGSRPPASGIKEIQQYWQREPQAQSEINVLIRNVSYGENVAICAFEGTFNTPINHVIIKGAHCFDFDRYSGKIARLTGNYETKKYPLYA